MKTDSCSVRRPIDAHFEGTLDPAGERAMREHLPTCAACHAHYRRRLLLARLDPQALSAEDRLGRGLGLGARPAPRARVRLSWAAAAATGLAVAAAALWMLRTAPTDEGFAARGGGPVQASSSALHVYRVNEAGPPSPLLDTLHAGDELAFAYENPEQKPYLMLFAVDELANVYWFYPAWTEASADPKAIAAKLEPGVHELPEGIKHRYAGSRLQLHTLLLDTPASVREVERALAAGALSWPGAVDHVRSLQVSP